MKVCNVKPDKATCSVCMDKQEIIDAIENCFRCLDNTDEYELLQIGIYFWGTGYAMVCRDGIINKVPLSRVYNVREKRETQE